MRGSAEGAVGIVGVGGGNFRRRELTKGRLGIEWSVSLVERRVIGFFNNQSGNLCGCSVELWDGQSYRRSIFDSEDASRARIGRLVTDSEVLN